MKGYNGIYLIGNYPDKKRFIDAAKKSLEFFDFLEVGIPFSDPVADGPMIAEKSFEIIHKGVKVQDILDTIKELRAEVPEDKKIFVMTYANHLYFRGVENFAQICKDTGINGVIIPDIPFPESESFKKIFAEKGLHFIHFITPENTNEQVEKAAEAADGFLYAVSVRGTTGGELSVDDDTAEKIKLAKEKSNAPVVLGFGVRSIGSVKNALAVADGCIIGTKMIELLTEEDNNSFHNFIEELKTNFS